MKLERQAEARIERTCKTCKELRCHGELKRMRWQSLRYQMIASSIEWRGVRRGRETIQEAAAIMQAGHDVGVD